MGAAGRWVVMGVSGRGKSTLGQLLAARLQCGLVEGDDEHPQTNIAKMRAGRPLDDADRQPWLLRLRAHIVQARRDGRNLVLTCSALKHSYRDLLRSGDPELLFLHLHGDAALLAARLEARTGHFMPAAMLQSQLRELESLASDEAGMRLDPGYSPEQLMGQIFQSLGQ